MALTISVASGVNHVYMLAFIFVLMWCTQCFGYYNEVVCRPDLSKGSAKRATRWVVNARAPDLLFFPEAPRLSAVAQRLAPHVLGYVPYATVWSALLHSFFSNAFRPGERDPPDFVVAIVLGQMAVFSLFGVTQLILTALDNGPFFYMWGEASYLVLSITAKGLLGGILLANVFMYDSFDDSLFPREDVVVDQ